MDPANAAGRTTVAKSGGVGGLLGARQCSVPETPEYDPDRTIFQDVNLDELSGADALAFADSYLNNPVTKARHEDLAREFRGLPADQQIATLLEVLASSRTRQREVAQRLKSGGLATDHREALEILKRACDEDVERIGARLRALRSGP
jgi:hypothetical protein